MKVLYERYKYSGAARAGDLVSVSGQVGSREDGSPEPDFSTQVQRAFDNFAATLEEAGASLADIVDLTTYHTDPEVQFPVLDVKDRIFTSEPFPNWTAVGVNWLAGFDFEIKIVARIPV